MDGWEKQRRECLYSEICILSIPILIIHLGIVKYNSGACATATASTKGDHKTH